MYEEILIAWNQRDAAAMAAHFEKDGNFVGYDGTQADSRADIEDHLRPIFADHPTAAYVAKVREIQILTRDVRILRAVVGMIPPGSDDIYAAGNTIQTLVAVQHADGWQATLFQSTPAAWHGRPQDSEALTEELREVGDLSGYGVARRDSRLRNLPGDALGRDSWILGGGLVYSAGALIYGLKRPNLVPGIFGFHELWHLFVMAGSTCHFWMMLRYIAPIS